MNLNWAKILATLTYGRSRLLFVRNRCPLLKFNCVEMEPGIIQKLDEVVVNRIAAGEVIQRPANALKELIENSLDAKSSFIQITIKAGGLKLLQIQDNGTGIRKEDMAIVCERFTTSKLTKFEDLSSIATYGFRGEALASISHVAHLTIQTKTAQERCAYKASYEDGKLMAAPKPCAGNQGTIITIEDLFYNMPQRKQALKSPAEEFQRISDVVGKYAVHNSNVGFTLKKDSGGPSLKTMVGSTKEQNVACIFGAQISKELMAVQMKDSVHKFNMAGLITKVNYSAKKGIFLLFINHRLVESMALKAAIDSVYSAYLPKGMHPFVYMSLELEPSNIDVNVHPTKHEVHFLYEDEIVEKIKANVETQLLGSNSTRTFYKQLKLPGLSEDKSEESANTEKNVSSTQKAILAKDMIRTDAKEQKLEKFLQVQSNTDRNETINSTCSFLTQATGNDERGSLVAKPMKEVRLSSVLSMQKRIQQACSSLLRRTLKQMVFVGVVNSQYALFQYETKLYLCNTLKFCEELFYQRLVYQFQNFDEIKIEPPLSIQHLVRIALGTEESGWTVEDGDKDELAASAADILQQKSLLMAEYFALRISGDGQLEALPSLIAKHCPSSTFLPLYMLRLATEVEWETEEECFESFCRETARFYTQMSDMEIAETPLRHKWWVEHVIYPALKQHLQPPNKLRKHLYELTSFNQLYKVFERC